MISEIVFEAIKKDLPEAIYNDLIANYAKYDITTKYRLAHLLGQCHHESGGFKVLVENLNYSADGLMKIFGRYFPGNSAQQYARNPQKIANRVYANRIGNGNEASGDGWRYKGRGCIQLTGKENYMKFDQTTNDNIIDNPDLIPAKYPISSAAWFFKVNGLLALCDKGVDVATITSISRRVNGGTIGLNERIELTTHYYEKIKDIS